MRQIPFAIRQYEEITCDRRPDASLIGSEKMRTWKNEDLIPALEEFFHRPRFREFARWPIDAFHKDSTNALRIIVNKIDAQFTVLVETLWETLIDPQVNSRLRHLFPPKPMIVGETVVITGDPKVPDQVVEQIIEPREPVDGMGGSLRFFLTRSFIVNVNDYFSPQQEFTIDPDKKVAVQRGGMIVSLRPRLLPVGNMIVRSLKTRVHDLEETLKPIWKDLQQGIPSEKQELKLAIEAMWCELVLSLKSLRAELNSVPNQKMIDACIAGTQIFGALKPQADLSWLGLDDDVVKAGSFAVQFRLTSLHAGEVLDRLVRHLAVLETLYEPHESDQSEFEKAVTEKLLVIRESDQTIYWKGEPLQDSQSRKPLSEYQFKLLFRLTQKTRINSSVTMNDIYKDKVLTDNAFAKLKGRLCSILPLELSELIQSTTRAGSAAYILKLAREQVQVF